ncbi:MAG: hypothetical protein Ct9H300mP15_02110 [Gemmatimonadota bacterium]|nr:MAG: hypothetical protein Ct9H300mP15_02110 [Gemmatimonadota bacterium]
MLWYYDARDDRRSFWEHLHRLVAGGLVLLFGLSLGGPKTPTQDQPWIFRACLAGLGLLIVQSIFGGLTVIYRLPDLISTTPLGLAFIFLALVTVFAWATGPLKTFESPLGEPQTASQSSLVPALPDFRSIFNWRTVRHMDAGMACPMHLSAGRTRSSASQLKNYSTLHSQIDWDCRCVTDHWPLYLDLTRISPEASPPLGLLAAALVVTQVIIGFVSVLTSLALSRSHFTHSLLRASWRPRAPCDLGPTIT